MSRLLKIVLLVIGGLVALFFLTTPAIPPEFNHSATIARTKAQLHLLATASRAYSETYRRWPASVRDITVNPRGILFMESNQATTNDGWGRPIIYTAVDPVTGYGKALSCGADGKPGGTGPDEDIEVRFGRE